MKFRDKLKTAFSISWQILTDNRWWGGESYPQAASGIEVTPASALRSTAVYGSIRVTSDSVAQLPHPLYKRTGEFDRERATDHPLYRLVNYRPNPRMTGNRFRKLMMAWLMARGNAYAWIERNRGGDIIGLWPLHPTMVTPKEGDNGAITYKVREKNGQTIDYGRDRILHLRGLSDDGIVGLSPIQLFRETIGLSLAAEKFSAQFFGNGARPGIVFESPKAVSPESRKRFLADWREEYSANGQGRPALLDNDIKLHEFSISQQDAQFIETCMYTGEQIAGCIYGVPPVMLGMNDKQTSWGTGVEAQQIGFLVNTLNPYLENISAEFNTSLLSEEEQETHFFEFLTDALIKPDTKTVAECLAIERDHGVINANEWRRLKNRPLIEGLAGEMYWRPAAFIPADSPAPEPKPSVIAKAERASGEIDIPIQIIGTRNGHGNHNHQ